VGDLPSRRQEKGASAFRES